MAFSKFLLLSLVTISSLFSPAVNAAPLEKRAISRVGSPGVMGSGTYPRVTQLSDGSLLGCYTKFSGGQTSLVTVKSTDSGSSWSALGTVATATTATTDLDNCFVHQLPNGQVLAAFRNHDRQSATGPYLRYRITLCVSSNNGASWTFLTQAAESATAGLGLWEPFMMTGLDNSLMLYYSRETNTNGSDQDNVVVRSGNNGVSFTGETVISGTNLVARDGMIGVARTAAGSKNLIAVFESLGPDTGIHSVTSSDDGLSWGNRRLVYKSSTSSANQAPQVVLVGSTLVASIQTKEDNVSASTTQIKVVASTDGGATWNSKTTVLDVCDWAGQYTISSTRWLVVCESKGSSLAQTMSL